MTAFGAARRHGWLSGVGHACIPGGMIRVRSPPSATGNGEARCGESRPSGLGSMSNASDSSTEETQSLSKGIPPLTSSSASSFLTTYQSELRSPSSRRLTRGAPSMTSNSCNWTGTCSTRSIELSLITATRAMPGTRWSSTNMTTKVA